MYIYVPQTLINFIIFFLERGGGLHISRTKSYFPPPFPLAPPPAPRNRIFSCILIGNPPPPHLLGIQFCFYVGI